MDRVLKHGGAWIIISHGLPEDRLEHLENDDSSSIEFLSFQCNVHALPKPLTDLYSIPDLKNPEELYFVYVCIKNPVKSKLKDDKKNRQFAAKEGKKALAKRLREIRQRQAEFGPLAKTPTRDQFGNPRTSDRRVAKVEEEELVEAPENAAAASEKDTGDAPGGAAAGDGGKEGNDPEKGREA